MPRVTPRLRTIGALALVGYIFTIYLANWAIQHWGIVSVGFGLMAPAAVYFVGIAFTLRDVVQRTLGLRAVLIGIAIGIAFSFFVSTRYAVASAVAFGLSELADLAVYTPLRARESHWFPAVVASNVVGAVVDSAIFLTIAFGSLAFFWGQVVGKLWMTVVAVIVLVGLEAFWPREPVPA